MKLIQFIPSLKWLRSYQKTDLKGDISAGLTVGVMLIPQGMAYSMLAGMPPIYGLYASTLPLIIYALLGTSRQLAVGPVAMVALLTAAGVGTIATAGSPEFIALAIGLALMVGVMQLLLGIFRLGYLVNFLSHPVISGFTSAAALIIGLSQLKHLLGIKLASSSNIYEIIKESFEKASLTHLPTLAIGIGGIIVILLLKKYLKAIPGQLVAVILGIGVVTALGLNEQGVKIVGDIPSGLPIFSFSMLELSQLKQLLPVAMAIALVSFMESIAVAKAIQAKHRDYKIDSNQELIALGSANIFGSFFQSFPVTGGFSRTAVNDQAGANTGLASIISAVLIILTLLFLTPLFYNLPQAILASVIMVAVFGLIDFHEPKHLWHSNRTDFAMLVVTFIATLVLGIEQGIATGVILSLIMVIFRSSRPHMAVLGRLPGTHIFRNIDRFDHLETREDVLIIRFDADLYFANINYFQEEIEKMIQERGTDQLKVLLIDCESINYVDSSAIHALDLLVKDYQERGISLYLSAIKGPVRDALYKSGIIKIIGEDKFFINKQEALEHLDILKSGQKTNSKYKEYTLQTNVE
jgi:sulfate permease, SulP family